MQAVHKITTHVQSVLKTPHLMTLEIVSVIQPSTIQKKVVYVQAVSITVSIAKITRRARTVLVDSIWTLVNSAPSAQKNVPYVKMVQISAARSVQMGTF